MADDIDPAVTVTLSTVDWALISTTLLLGVQQVSDPGVQKMVSESAQKIVQANIDALEERLEPRREQS